MINTYFHLPLYVYTTYNNHYINFQREEFGPSGYSVVKQQQQPLSQSFYHHQQQQSSSVLKSKSLSNFSHKIDHDGHEAIKKALPPLPSASTSTSSRPLIKERLSKAYDERPPVSRRTSQKYLANNNNNIGNGNNYDYNISAASSRRPSISGEHYDEIDNFPKFIGTMYIILLNPNFIYICRFSLQWL